MTMAGTQPVIDAELVDDDAPILIQRVRRGLGLSHSDTGDDIDTDLRGQHWEAFAGLVAFDRLNARRIDAEVALASQSQTGEVERLRVEVAKLRAKYEPPINFWLHSDADLDDGCTTLGELLCDADFWTPVGFWTGGDRVGRFAVRFPTSSDGEEQDGDEIEVFNTFACAVEFARAALEGSQ